MEQLPLPEPSESGFNKLWQQHLDSLKSPDSSRQPSDRPPIPELPESGDEHLKLSHVAPPSRLTDISALEDARKIIGWFGLHHDESGKMFPTQLDPKYLSRTEATLYWQERLGDPADALSIVTPKQVGLFVQFANQYPPNQLEQVLGAYVNHDLQAVVTLARTPVKRVVMELDHPTWFTRTGTQQKMQKRAIQLPLTALADHLNHITLPDNRFVLPQHSATQLKDLSSRDELATLGGLYAGLEDERAMAWTRDHHTPVFQSDTLYQSLRSLTHDVLIRQFYDAVHDQGREVPFMYRHDWER